MVSDVRVTLKDGRTLDVLQKVYPVSNDVIAGFAGSVKAGFTLLEDLRNHLILPTDAPQGSSWYPDHVAATWPARAVRIFASLDESERRLGCQILTVTIHPTEDVIPGRAAAYIIRFACPEFHAGMSGKRGSVISIGSGSRVVPYRRKIRQVMRNPSLLQLEVGNTGGWAFGLNMATSFIVDDDKTTGVSQNLHVMIAERGRYRLGTNDRISYTQDGSVAGEVKMPEVATSFRQFCEILRVLGVNAGSAKC